MNIIRFQDATGHIGYGQPLGNNMAQRIHGDLFGDFQVSDQTAEVAKLLAPIVPPTILCIGLNYKAHAEETGAKLPEFPVLFIKAANTLNHPEEPIMIPRVAPGQVDYECELAVIIGRSAKNVKKAEALDYVLGYTCANDVSARRWQKEGGGKQWCRGKSFDTFCPLGPHLVTRDDIPNPNDLRISTRLNGEVMQNSNTSDMIFDIPSLISFLSQSTTLLPGTTILTGTPSGVGFTRTPPVFLEHGDQVTVEIEQIGALKNPVQDEK
ncbi:MAG: fumarylacetoacetate hydrolase family protein [Nitrospirales bacterium]|nr:fumarylacetoacetate hydrolase family protein [Nitrospira sp.]MDR4499982.1 fumarylacetoacetate hydrolase family protein [Nitrospirales bacterium]